MLASIHDSLDQIFVYHPAPWIERDWARISGLPLQDVTFQAGDRTQLFGWFVPSAANAPVLLWCHGNAGNIIHRLENLVELHNIGLAVFLFDYRGYGRSLGRPSEKGLYQDALAAYTHLVDEKGIDPAQIVLFGRSLGAAVAGDLASRRRAAGLILESAFPSIAAVAKDYVWGLPAHWLLVARFNLTERLPRISMPVLIIHGDRDQIVPFQLGEQVFAAARPPKEFYRVDGADHNNLYSIGGKTYFRRLRQFVEQTTR